MQQHTPVLVAEVLNIFKPKPGNTLLDATLGTGGHTEAYLNATGPSGKVVGIDADSKALTYAQRRLAHYENRIAYLHTNFANLKDSVTGGGIVESNQSTFPSNPPIPTEYTHILFDLGVGSHQIADGSRGFSFESNAPIDMRYGQHQHLPNAQVSALNELTRRLGRYPSAADLIRYLSADALADVLYSYGEEHASRRIAKAIHEHRSRITTSAELAEVIRTSIGRRGRLHPATKSFQALRLAVNRELEALATALPQAVQVLASGGILAVISFHSLEDRIVKHFFKGQDALEVLTKKPMGAQPEEIAENPRARSAKLRAAQKIAPP